MSGTSRKFRCAIGDDVVKVRYGATNGEVEGAVLATRLLWALGFVADRVYPVVVRCRGCSSDPWNRRAPEAGEHLFDPAVIERNPPGQEMDGKDDGGWSWPELDLVDERLGGATEAQRDALMLLAAFMQHTDTKPEQQRLLCAPDALNDNGECTQPFMFTHDVGLTFGRANAFNHASTGSVNFVEWSRTPVWRGATGCQAYLSKSNTGTLENPRISEEGRQFLADLLVELTDRQLRDLFTVAKVDRRPRDPGHANEAPATIDEWVRAFQRKRTEVVMRRCTTTTS
jgi:hypothetical protein